MSFLAILIGIFVERFLGSLEEWRRFDWFDFLDRQILTLLPEHPPWRGTLGMLILLALPLVLVMAVGGLLSGLWVGFGFLFALAVLLYCIGPRDLEAEVEAYLDARERGDEESACWHAASLLGEEVPEDPAALSRAMVEAVLVEAHERLLGVVFWFALLGPAGALLYRLAVRLRRRYRSEEGEYAEAIAQLHHLLAWIPARLCALGYALSGSFVHAMQRWRGEADTASEPNRGVLLSAGLGALQLEAEAAGDDAPIREALSLAKRTVFIWIAFLAVMTLAGWTG